MITWLCAALIATPLANKEVDALVERALKGEAQAVKTLTRHRSKRGAERLAPTLGTQPAGDRKTADLLELLAAASNPKTVSHVSAWLAAAKPVDSPTARRSFSAAIRYAARHPLTEKGADGLAQLAVSEESSIAQAALMACADNKKLNAKRHIAIWTAALLRGRYAEAAPALNLLVRANAVGAISTIIESGEHYESVNPNEGAPHHVAALRTLTKKSYGPNMDAWRKVYPRK